MKSTSFTSKYPVPVGVRPHVGSRARGVCSVDRQREQAWGCRPDAADKRRPSGGAAIERQVRAPRKHGVARPGLAAAVRKYLDQGSHAGQGGRGTRHLEVNVSQVGRCPVNGGDGEEPAITIVLGWMPNPQLNVQPASTTPLAPAAGGGGAERSWWGSAGTRRR
jgi:hypothetical protein